MSKTSLQDDPDRTRRRSPRRHGGGSRLVRSRRALVSPGLTLALLSGFVAARSGEILGPDHEDSGLATVQDVRALLPMRSGAWFGVDNRPETNDATRGSPCRSLSRHYENLVTGQSVNLVAILCRNSLSLQGHSQPVRRAGERWIDLGADRKSWPLPRQRMRGTLRRFLDPAETPAAPVLVYSTLATAGGETFSDLGELRRARLSSLALPDIVLELRITVREVLTDEEERDLLTWLVAPALEAIEKREWVATAG